jgi:hypothetical protein
MMSRTSNYDDVTACYRLRACPEAVTRPEEELPIQGTPVVNPKSKKMKRTVTDLFDW